MAGRASKNSPGIVNQPPPFEGLDLFSSDAALREAVRREGAGGHETALRAFGVSMGSAETALLARQAHEHVPELRAFDRFGARIDEVDYHPAYHAIMAMGIEAGVAAVPWQELAGGHVFHAALEFLLAEVEPSTCCPLTMTYAALPALKHRPEIATLWKPMITAQKYDPRPVPVPYKAGVTLGMAMTERQGGSDVRANITRAERAGDAYVLTGEKWFCSAPMSDAFLTLTQTSGGLTCFLVPRWRPDGIRNAIHILRLKDKLGDRANASAEIAFGGAQAIRIGEEGRGVSTILEMVHHTRLDCTIAPAAYMRSGVAQALWHASHRQAFGRPLIEHGLMRSVLADLIVESEAATVLAFRIARSFDEALSDESAALFSRLVTPVGKYWLNKRVVGHVAEAMECHGGSGYILEWPIARLYRQAPLNGIWEGSGNIICLDVLRALERQAETRDAFLAELALSRGGNAAFDRAVDDLAAVLNAREGREDTARRVVEAMAVTLQSALLIRHAPAAIADAFCASRLTNRTGGSYGTLPIGIDIAAILSRGMPLC